MRVFYSNAGYESLVIAQRADLLVHALQRANSTQAGPLASRWLAT